MCNTVFLSLSGLCKSCQSRFTSIYVERLRLVGLPNRLHRVPSSSCAVPLTLSFPPQRYIHTSASRVRIFEVPSDCEVIKLKTCFEDPHKLVHEVLQPLVTSGHIKRPKVEFTPKLNGRYWRAKLCLKWPFLMTFTGLHSNFLQAEENAYLQACYLFLKIGLLYKDKEETRPVKKSHVFEVLEELAEMQPFHRQLKPFHLNSTHHQNGIELLTWTSTLSVAWPFPFYVTSSSPDIHTSLYMVCLLTNIKLKYYKLLSSNNSLCKKRIEYLKKKTRPKTVCVETMKPHYQIYVDASRVGFGAYLLTNTDNRVRWMSESWPQHFKTERDSEPFNYLDSNFIEFYALLAACYTWKHKFVNMRVLCWSDNEYSVLLVNRVLTDGQYRNKFRKLSYIMEDMCRTYNILLRARHVKRIDNTAADFLSRVQVEKFREVIPKAEGKAKKTKKLLFLKPLVEKDEDESSRKIH